MFYFNLILRFGLCRNYLSLFQTGKKLIKYKIVARAVSEIRKRVLSIFITKFFIILNIIFDVAMQTTKHINCSQAVIVL